MKISQGIAALLAFVLALLVAPAQADENCRLHTSNATSLVSRTCLDEKQGGESKSVDTYQMVVQPTTLTGKTTSAATATVPAFKFDTSVTHTSGNLFEIYDGGVLKYAVDYSGTVTVGAGGATTASNGLTESGGDVKLGGTLAADTTVATASHALIAGGGDQCYPTFSAGAGVLVNGCSIASSAAIRSVYQVGANDRRGASAIVSQYGFSADSNSWTSDASPNITGHAHIRAQTDITDVMIDIFGSDGAGHDGELSYTPAGDVWMISSTAINLPGYLSTRDDSATTPVNFLFTDSSGNMKARPLNSTAFRTAANVSAARLNATSAALGGGALTASCASNATTVTGATTAMTAIANPTGDITSGNTVAFSVLAAVTAANTVTVRVCGTGTPTSRTYLITVFP